MTKRQAPTPKLSRRGRLLFGWTAGLILAATLSLHFWYFPLFGQKPSNERPVMAEGRVVAKDSFRNAAGTLTTRIIYQFQTRTGGFVEGQSSGKPERWTAIRIGDTIRILYSESDPLRNRPVSTGTNGK